MADFINDDNTKADINDNDNDEDNNVKYSGNNQN
jgi:hypothetical protein